MSDNLSQTIEKSPEELIASLKGLSNDELKKKIKEGGPELELIRKDKDLQERFLKGELTASDPEPALSVDPAKPTAEPEKTPVKPGDEWMGFGSKDKMVTSFQNAQDLIPKLKGKLDDYNAERGQMGQKVKNLETQYSEAQKRAEGLEKQVEKLNSKTSIPDEKIELGDMPQLPKPDKESGEDIWSDEYQGKINKYNEDMSTYTANLQKQVSSSDKRSSGLEKRLGEISSYIEEQKKANQTREQQEAQTNSQNAVSTLFKDVEELQKNNTELQTSKPFQEVDQYINQVGLDDAKKVMSAQDIENWEKIIGIVKDHKGVDNNGAISLLTAPRYKDLGEAYVLFQHRHDIKPKAGATEKEINEQIVNAKREQHNNTLDAIENRGKTAQDLPNESLGSHENLNQLSEQDKVKKYRELLGEFKLNPGKFRKDNIKFQEFEVLSNAMGLPVPKSKPLPR